MQKLTQEMLDLRWPKDVQRSVLLEVFHKCAEGISSDPQLPASGN